MDEVAERQAKETSEALKRGERLRQRDEELELLERESRIRQSNLDSLRGELEVVVTKSKLSGPSPEHLQQIQELTTQVKRLEDERRVLEQNLLTEKFTLQIEALRAEIRANQVTGMNTNDLIFRSLETGGPLIFGELRGIRTTLETAFSRVNPPSNPKKPPISPEEAAQIAEKMRLQQEGLDAPTPAQGETCPLCGGAGDIPSYLLGRSYEELVGVSVLCGSCKRSFALNWMLHPAEFAGPPVQEPDNG
ncbi:MAG: hypothetical protein HY673_12710 [Chloroflexi bacterium]|nr:hypothetical protein [Chloroflexota bacterium]